MANNLFETIKQSIDILQQENAKQEAALTAKLQELKTKSDAAGAAADAAFAATNIDEYYTRLSERRTADDEYRMLEVRLEKLRKEALITESEYESFIQKIVEYDADERAKAEKEAYKHIVKIKSIAEKSISRSDAARALIHRLQHEIYRDKPLNGAAVHAYIQERDQTIKPEALATLQTYLCDPSYPTTAYIYTAHTGAKGETAK